MLEVNTYLDLRLVLIGFVLTFSMCGMGFDSFLSCFLDDCLDFRASLACGLLSFNFSSPISADSCHAASFCEHALE